MLLFLWAILSFQKIVMSHQSSPISEKLPNLITLILRLNHCRLYIEPALSNLGHCIIKKIPNDLAYFGAITLINVSNGVLIFIRLR